MSDIRLTEAQKAAVTVGGNSVLVSAAAGSGKTRVLIERLFERVCGPEKRDLDEFLIITYTRAAAEELRGRIATELGKRLALNPSDRHLRSQSLLLYKAQISTVHSFCSKLVRENAHICGLPPDFRIAEEDECAILLDRVLEDILEARYSEPTEDFLSLADTLGAGRDDKKLMDIIAETYRRTRNQPDPSSWGKSCIEALQKAGKAPAEESIWGRAIIEKARGIACFWTERLNAAYDLILGSEALEKAYGDAFRKDIWQMENFAVAAEKGWDEARACLPFKFEALRQLRSFPDDKLKQRLQSIRNNCKKAARSLEDMLDCSSSEEAEDIAAVVPPVRALFDIVSELDSAYLKEKQKRSIVDFSDLERYAVILLTGGKDFAPTELARNVSSRYCEVLVDEFQDSNVIQNLIFTAVSDEGRRLFMVGDVRQSIYRFNLADPGVFLSKYRAFRNWTEAGVNEPKKVVLAENFRSRPEIAEAVNFVFSRIMSTELGEMDYGKDEYLIADGSFPVSADKNVELNILDCAGLTGADRNRAEAGYVARRVHELLQSGFEVTEGNNMRPVRPEDIVILMRSPGTKAAAYVRALGELGIEARADSQEGFMNTPEVSSMLSLLNVLDNPRQDVELISVLRSPLWGFSEDTLAEIRASSPDGDFYDALTVSAREDGELRDFLDTICSWREKSADLTLEELMRQIYAQTAALSVFGAMPDGDRRRRNLLALFDHICRFGARGERRLFDFTSYLRRLRERGGELAPPPPGTGNAVRIMSIHKSKGLEFPVVFIAGLGSRFNREDTRGPLLIHPVLGVGPKRLDLERRIEYSTAPRTAIAMTLEREMLSEEMRILYVAMTRPRDKLIMTVSFPDAEKTLQRLAEIADTYIPPQGLAGLGSPGEWLALTAMLRPEASALREAAGSYVTSLASCQYTWDIRLSILREDDGPSEAGREETLKSLPEPPGQAVEAVASALSFKYPHSDSIDAPSKVTATELKGRLLDFEAAEGTQVRKRSQIFARPDFGKDASRLTGAEKGIAIHLAMQYIDFSKCGTLEGIKSELERLSEMRFLTPEQAAAVEPERILKLFRSELGRSLITSRRVMREFKFSILMPAKELMLPGGDDKILLQGVVDCFLEDERGITVIDFKSDRVTYENALEKAGEYAVQIETYSKAVERITGKPVLRRVLYFFEADREIDV
ncbi:MAG: helicase-exonuclease AddAB subunit AddA [Oscillospiraceae bacterium]|jgi:ATP-dependent helicase/nuclease subunit A